MFAMSENRFTAPLRYCIRLNKHLTYGLAMGHSRSRSRAAVVTVRKDSVAVWRKEHRFIRIVYKLCGKGWSADHKYY